MPPDPAHRERLLKWALLAAIFLAAAPELFAALESQILLDMLGATLFATAFIAGARLALLDLGGRLRKFLVPSAPVAFIAVAYLDCWLASITAGICSIRAIWSEL